jgi:hypothetical protein
MYSTSEAYAEEMRACLLTGAGSKNALEDLCEAQSEHGFVGMEAKTVKAVLAWIRTGQAPSEISE